ncbi:D(4) dopamine receptor-like [Branchiostoma floridae]|uniref:D(4) dopamine receptor-like n=1 Tax=Branchiostoma floridae TaxID=7739 RepID=A0A9J7HS49_BRAFL|nr:D(4) dopamine receptor-like [Branchiostoma floridae]
MAGNGTEGGDYILPTELPFSWDDLFLENATTNITEEQRMERDDLEDVRSVFPNYTALLSIPLIAGTVFGNCLVIMAVYRERNLRSITNYFIVSLAVTDALMAVLVMPLAVYFEVMQMWTMGFVMCDVFVTFDVMFCTASIFNLVAISIDRFYAVTWPVHYAKHKSKSRPIITVSIVWLLSFSISCPLLFGVNNPDVGIRQPGTCGLENGDYVIYSSVCSFFIPCTVMLVLYYKILKKIKERTKKLAPKSTMSSNPSAPSAGDTLAMDELSEPTAARGMHKSDTQTTNLGTDDDMSPNPSFDTNDDTGIPGQANTISWNTNTRASTALVDNRRERREKVSLAVIRSKFKIRPKDDFPNKREQKAINVMKIVIGVFLFCWLPFFVANVLQACQSCQVSPTMFSVLTWLGYVNSAVNPVIYTIFNPEFKKAFKKILLCRQPSRRVR